MTTFDPEGRLYISFECELAKLSYFTEDHNTGFVGFEYIGSYVQQGDSLHFSPFYPYHYTNLRTLRALVRSLLMQRQPDAAMKQANHILGNPALELTDDDLLLIGSAQWLTGQRDDALRTWSVMEETPPSETLIRLGIPAADTPFLLDLLRPKN